MASAAGLLLLGEIVGKDLSLGGKERLGKYLIRMAGFFAFVAACLAVLSAYQWLRINYQSDSAAILTATIALGLAIVFSVSAGIVSILRQRRLKRIRQDMMDELQKVFYYLENEFVSAPVQENPKTAAIMASVAGFAVGDRFL